MLSDIEIASQASMAHIGEIARGLGLDPAEDIELYGRYKAKINDKCYRRVLENNLDGKLILVTAINPTPAGEGKTTTTIGLGQALSKIGYRAVVALREPSLGPVFGIKGGAAGGGYSQVVPMDDINLHFTGDFHAITTANNLLCAMIDNHIHQGNSLGINPGRIIFKRCLDMNDRALREILVGLGAKTNGVPRADGFNITAASEIMAIVCLASSLEDLRERLGNIITGYNFDGEPVYCRDLNAHGAMTAILREAINPNLVQTLENTPCLIHGGPFANIAHGCNSIRATRMAMKLGDFAVTEAGFGADLGAEKFFDIKCRLNGLNPDAVVLVATLRALKYNAGVDKSDYAVENTRAIAVGFANLVKHAENIRAFGYSPIVALNRFATDTEDEIAFFGQLCGENGIRFALSDAHMRGGDGAVALAEMVVASCSSESPVLRYMYRDDDAIEEKIRKIACGVYGADGVSFSPEASAEIERITALGYGGLPVCIAKTQYSFSDDPGLLCRPSGFTVSVKEIRISSGAGFIVALTGKILTMPGLPKTPAAEAINVGESGRIQNLF